MAVILSNSLPDSASIDLGSIPKNIIDYSILYQSDDLETNVEKEAINFNENPEIDNKCIINFFKLAFCIVIHYKNNNLNYDVVEMFGLHGICLYINILYTGFKYIFKTCLREHPNLLEARKCCICSRRLNEDFVRMMKNIHTQQWKPKFRFGIASSYLHHHILGLWFSSPRCLPRQDVDQDLFSD